MNWDAVGRRHGTDKASDRHDYLRHYESFFDGRRIEHVLEIGVDEGRSLLTWADIWPDANVWGIEINRYSPQLTDLLAGQRCTVLIGDATTKETIEALPSCEWDVIIDDGSHQFDDQAASMLLLAPRLSLGGAYVIEDVPWSDIGASGANIIRVLGLFIGSGLLPVGVVWSALRHHVAVIARRPA